MQSTIELLRHFYNNLPPLVPEGTKNKMADALRRSQNDQEVSLAELESVMIELGYELWPWRQAHQEFLSAAEHAVGEHFLLPRLSPQLTEKYHDFKRYGGTLEELRTGRPAEYFSMAERQELAERLVELSIDLKRYAEQEILGLKKESFLKRVTDYKALLHKIKRGLDRLRALAHSEDEYPMLAKEISAKVRGFEHGLSLLGPAFDHEAVMQAIEFFEGRKRDLARLRGIEKAVNIDFYTE